MATFTLDTLRAVVNKKYAPTIIENGSEVFKLQNIFQLPEEKRAAVEKLHDAMSDEDADTAAITESFKQIFVEVEESGNGEKLVKLLGDNAAMIVELGTAWAEGTQVGEAADSSE